MTPVVLAYVGPEAALPLLSVLAAIFGAVLIGWRWIVSFFRRLFRIVTGRGPAPPVPVDPQAAQAAKQPADAER